MRIIKNRNFALAVFAGFCLVSAQGTNEVTSVVSTAKDMFNIVVPVAGLLLFYERRMARVEEKLDNTQKQVTNLAQSIERML